MKLVVRGLESATTRGEVCELISCHVDTAPSGDSLGVPCPPVSGVVRPCGRNALLSCSAGWPQHTAVINYQHHLITKITEPLFGLCQLSRGRTVGRDIQPDPPSSWQLVLIWSWSCPVPGPVPGPIPVPCHYPGHGMVLFMFWSRSCSCSCSWSRF